MYHCSHVYWSNRWRETCFRYTLGPYFLAGKWYLDRHGREDHGRTSQIYLQVSIWYRIYFSFNTIIFSHFTVYNRREAKWHCPPPPSIPRSAIIETIATSYSYTGYTVYSCDPGYWFERGVFSKVWLTIQVHVLLPQRLSRFTDRERNLVIEREVPVYG